MAAERATLRIALAQINTTANEIHVVISRTMVLLDKEPIASCIDDDRPSTGPNLPVFNHPAIVNVVIGHVTQWRLPLRIRHGYQPSPVSGLLVYSIESSNYQYA